MKKCIFMAMTALFVCCSDQQLTDGVTDVKSKELVQTSDDKEKFDALVEKARWGDGQAFLQLADCYRDGIGVKKDFLGMMYMVKQANEVGAIDKEEKYFARLSDEDVYKRCFDIINLSNSELRAGKDSIQTILNAMDNPDALAMCGIVSVECGDTVGGFETIQMAADNGSDFASVLQTMRNSNWELRPDKNKLKQIADKIPMAYSMLGRIYSVFEKDNDTNKRQKAHYYLEAEKHALLSKWGAAWLLSYYEENGDIQLTDEDVKRLEARFYSYNQDNEKEVVVADTMCVDSIDNQ